MLENLFGLILSRVIQEERSLSLIVRIIAFRCLIEMANSCLSLDQREMEMGSSINLVVRLSTKGTIKSW